MFSAVVFDMDGVITDTEKLYRRFQKETGREYGIPEDVMDIACNRIAGGNKYTNKKVFEEVVGRGIDYFVYREDMMKKLDAHIREHGVELKAGVRETLAYLSEHGIKIGLATSTVKERAEKNLRQNGIYEYFDELVYGDMIDPGRGKPCPDIYLKACERLGVAPCDAVGVEDSRNGVRSVHDAGMYTVMVIDLILPDHHTEPYTDKVYDRMDEMLELFKEA